MLGIPATFFINCAAMAALHDWFNAAASLVGAGLSAVMWRGVDRA